MSSFILPSEILFLIAADINTSRDAYNLIRVSRQFYLIFIAQVYATIHLGITKFRTLTRLVRTLLRRPDLAHCVRRLELHHWKTTTRKRRDTPSIHADYALVHDAVAACTSADERATWDTAVDQCVADAWIALLLPLVSNVRFMLITFPDRPLFVLRMMEKAAKREKPFDRGIIPFPKLTEVFVRPYNNLPSLDSTLVNSLFQLPALQRLTAAQVSESLLSNMSNSNPLTHVSAVTEMNLVCSNGAQGFREWIEFCNGLKTFRMMHGGTLVDATPFDPVAFHRSLSSQKHSLETLWLGKGEHDLWQDETGLIEDQWMGSWKDFPRLKRLHLRMCNLLGLLDYERAERSLKDVLPVSIEELWIVDCNYPLFEDLCEDLLVFIRYQNESQSRLRKIDLEICLCDGAEGSTAENPLGYEITQHLRMVCKDQGTEFRLRDYHSPALMTRGDVLRAQDAYGESWFERAHCAPLSYYYELTG